MVRVAQDTISQRRLLDLLRVEVARHHDGAIRRLAAENPHAILSTHVAYNLGREKYRYITRVCDLDARAAEAARARARAAAASMRPARSIVRIAAWFHDS